MPKNKNMKEKTTGKIQPQFQRTEMLLGTQAMNALQSSHVAVFGVGGVGGYVVEALARSGVGALTLFDADVVAMSNVNRQIIALLSTVGRPKVEVAAERIADINPDCKVETRQIFYLPENADEVNLETFDYVVDCVDTVSAKLELLRRCQKLGVPIISCMGAANKMNPATFRMADLSQTKVDPLAKIIRRKLRAEGILHAKVVFSEEEPMKPDQHGTNQRGNDEPRRSVPASNAFVPPAEGLVAAAEVVRDLIGRA